jgi:hypothetical protein
MNPLPRRRHRSLLESEECPALISMSARPGDETWSAFPVRVRKSQSHPQDGYGTTKVALSAPVWGEFRVPGKIRAVHEATSVSGAGLELPGPELIVKGTCSGPPVRVHPCLRAPPPS